MAVTRPIRRRLGFTLIELLVVLAVVALLLSIVAPRSVDHVDRARDATLRATLKEVRSAIDQFEADRGRPPASLEELVERRYLRELPYDPVTERRDTWLVSSPGDAAAGGTQVVDVLAGVSDVRSGAPGAAHDGTPYHEF